MTEIGLKNRKCANISVSMLHLLALSVYLVFSLSFLLPCFEFGLLEAQIHCFALNQLRAETGWLVTYLIPILHTLALFMTTLVFNAGHKMAALTDVV